MGSHSNGHDWFNLALPLEFSPDEKYLEYRSWGFLIAVHIIHFGCLPPNISPVLIQAVIGGCQSIVNYDFIRATTVDTFPELLKWLQTPAIQNLSSDHDLLLYVASNIGEQVRLCGSNSQHVSMITS